MHVQRPALVVEQRQKLNPRMLQSIKILAMPAMELSELIQAELETNPALEVVKDPSEISLESFSREESDSAMDSWEDDNADFAYANSDEEDSKRKFLEGAVYLPETLHEHLLSQFCLFSLEPDQRELGERLIQNLDQDGFHIIDPAELKGPCSDESLNRIKGLIQGLDPQGSCTADYKESLAVQAALRTDAPAGALEVLRNHLEALERGKHAEIRKALGLKEPQLERILEFIKTLNPFPGRLFSTQAPRYVIPDLAMRMQGGELVIELNDEILPVLGIDPLFESIAQAKRARLDSARAARSAQEEKAESFVREKVEKARFFIGSVEQRKATLLKVARSIGKFQAAFFSDGPQAMKPLTLKDVAEDVGVHETTVSRIANGKYMQTEWGIFELRRFFTNAVAASAESSAQHSKESVKAVLREILESESGRGSPLSDRELVDILLRRGIKIARRTVAKYRGELALDSSFGRRKR
ncbi:MAG TPA: RNA polymerase factor sigma-54 [Rectinemataceae bacterium]